MLTLINGQQVQVDDVAGAEIERLRNHMDYLARRLAEVELKLAATQAQLARAGRKENEMTKRIDTDVLALQQAVKALNKSTSRRMLKASIEYIVDRFISRPTKNMPKHLRPDAGREGEK